MALSKDIGVSAESVYGFLRRLGYEGKNQSFWEPTQEHHNIILGTLLGDGYARNVKHKTKVPDKAILQLCHSMNQEQWVIHKYKSLGNLFLGKKHTNYKQYSEFGGKEGFTWKSGIASNSHQALAPYQKLFYTRPPDEVRDWIGEKRITTSILDLVNDQALAIWFGDDGTFSGHSISLILGGVTKPEHELTAEWLGDQGLPVKITPVGTQTRWPVKDDVVRLYWDVATAPKVVERILPFLPPSLHYKLGPWSPISI